MIQYSIPSTYNKDCKNSEEVVLTPDPTVMPHPEGLEFGEWMWEKWAGQRNVDVPDQEHSTH